MNNKKRNFKKNIKTVINKENIENTNGLFGSDDNFAFIAGFTSNGVPYGITHDQMKNEESEFKEEIDINENEEKIIK